MTDHAQVDDFGIGKSIFDQLKDLSPERQQRILRWVAEGLGVPQGMASTQLPQFASTQQTPKGTPTTGTGIDIKSFIAAKEPKSDNQFAAAVAYYYRFEAPHDQKRDSINAEVLQQATRLSGRSRLGDPGKTLRNATGMGYLDAIDRGEFKVNSVGENLVAMTLPSQGRTVAARPVKKQPHKINKKRK